MTFYGISPTEEAVFQTCPSKVLLILSWESAKANQQLLEKLRAGDRCRIYSFDSLT